MRYVLKTNTQRTFIKPETAAQWALDNDLNPTDFVALEDGNVRRLEPWEQSEIRDHMRDQSPLI